MAKSRKQLKKQRRTRKRKTKKGGFTNYIYLIDKLKEDETLNGIKQVLDELRGREGDYLPDIDLVRSAIPRLNVNSPQLKDTIKILHEKLLGYLEDLDSIQGSRVGGSNSQPLIIPTNAIKLSVPEPSNKIA